MPNEGLKSYKRNIANIKRPNNVWKFQDCETVLSGTTHINTQTSSEILFRLKYMLKTVFWGKKHTPNAICLCFTLLFES